MSVDRQKLLRNADQAVRKGDLARAVLCYQELVDHFPDDLPLLQRLGDAQTRAGDEDAGRVTLAGLAELYRDKGDRSRSIAILKRAVRLGVPDPELLSRLGDWLVAGGFLVDARTHLHQAAEIYSERGQVDSAVEQYRKLIGANPSDTKALTALSESCREMESSLERAALSFELSSCCEKAGHFDEAREFALLGLADEPEAILRDRLRRGLCGLCARQGAWDHLAVDAPVAQRIVQAWARNETGDPSLAAELLKAVGHDDATPLRLKLLIGRLLAEAGDCSAAAKVVLAVSEGPELDDLTTRESLDALGMILERDPSQHAAMERMVALSPEISQVPDVAASPSAAPTLSSAKETLTPQVRAKLVEAVSMLDHDLPEKALEAIAQLPEEDRNGVEVSKVSRRAEAALAGRRELAAAARSAAPAAAEPVASATPPGASGDEEWEISFEEDEGLEEAVARTEPVPGPKDPPLPPAQAVAPPPKEAQALDRLDEELVAAIGHEESETRYQMAIGLVEMGLEDQAIPLFQQLCDGGDRALDAGLFLLKAHVKGGALQDGLDAGQRALEAMPERGGDLRFQLLALCSQVAYQLGLKSRAQENLETLRRLAPDHPLVGRLESWMASSR